MLNLADVVFRVGRAYGMTADRGIYRAVAVQDGRITAVGRSRDELDSFIGPGTAVIDDPELVLYPAFNDTHNHQLLAARDLDYVSLEQARSIDELVQALREAADRTPSGEWVISSRCWHETHLRESRLPTARELDAASADHPVFVQRGGHVGVANSAALRMAGITATSADPVSGTVVRLGDRTPVGVLIEGGALEPVRRLLPPVSEAQQAELLARQCRLYNRRGIGVVRDPGLVPGEVAVYQAVADRGELTTRTRLMFWVMPQATVADTLAYVDALPAPGSVAGDGGGLGIWGLKLGMDGGVEGGFLCEPYANNPAFRGHAFWEPDDFEQVVEHAVGRGWQVGCMPSETARSAASWTPTSRWRCGTRTCRRERWSSSTLSWPTLPLAGGRCGWASGSPSSIRCCTPSAATWCATGVRTAPARSCRSGPGSTRGR